MTSRSDSSLGSVRDLDPAELSKLREPGRIVDVREPSEWHGELGHIEGALLVPLGELSSAQHGWAHHEPVVLVCRSGRRSMAAAQLLLSLGFQHVMNLRGGMLAYRAVFPR